MKTRDAKPWVYDWDWRYDRQVATMIRLLLPTNRSTMHRKTPLILILALLGLSLAACVGPTSGIASPSGGSGAGSASGGVDVRFRELYDLLGGRDKLGAAISPRFSRDGIEYQYTAAALMMYDPVSNQYSLASIGRKLGIAEPTSNPSAPGGHDIYEGFLPMYEMLRGTRFVGVPLTAVRYSEARRGIEQYFENLGFYQLETDTPNVVHLMYYGAWLCADACGADVPPVSAPDLPSVMDTPFSDALSRLAPEFTGKPLSLPFLAPDGIKEQIYENVVVVSDSSKPGGIALRPITAMLGVRVDFNAGFDVPQQFHRFIMENSGYELSGNVATAFAPQSDEVYRQCFTNMCLDYFPNKPEEVQVQPTALGYLYKSRYYQDMPAGDVAGSGGSLVLTVSEGYNLVAPNASQIISVYVSEDYQPLGGATPVLILTLPGGAQRSYNFGATRPSDGFSTISLDPIDAPHGTRIDYQVCVQSNSGQQVCVADFFLIWGSP